MKKNLFLLCMLFLLSSCTTSTFTTPTSTAIPTNTPKPTATITPTVEPTKNPQQVASTLGLDQNRTYLINDNYLIDQFNLAPKAILNEDGSWRALDINNQEDLEIMYGKLVPNENFINPSMYTTRQTGFNSFFSMAVYLGDIVFEDKQYKDGTVQVPFLLVGLRDKSSQLRLVKYAFDATGVEPEHWTDVFCSYESGQTYIPIYHSLSETLADLKPGQQIRIQVFNPQQQEFTPNLTYENKEKWPQLNNAADIMMIELTQSDIENGIAYEEWKALEDEIWPERIVCIYDRLTLWEPCDISE